MAHQAVLSNKISIDYKVLLLLDNASAHPSTEKLVSADEKVTTSS